MSWIFVIVGILCLYLLQLLRGALNLVFPQMRTEFLSRHPDSRRVGGRDLFDAAQEELRALGFEGPCWLENTSAQIDKASVSMHAAWWDRDRKVVVWLAPPIDVNAPNRLLTYYSTSLKDGRYAVTQVSDPYFEAVRDLRTPAHTIAPTSFRTELDEHLAFVASLDSEATDALISRHAVQRFASEHMNGIRARLLERGLVKESNGVVRPTIRFALRILRLYFTRPKAAERDAGPVPVDRLVHLAGVLKQAQQRAPARSTQWLLLLMSAILFIGIGWPVLGAQFTLIVLGVIVFHEAGHWVAMRAAGYCNPHITLLPLLGGVTIGHETDPSAAKRAWVSLAGPVPGVILGWALVYWLYGSGFETDATGWITMSALLLLIINYLNVLPIPPLDGSHVVRALLSPRRAFVHIVSVFLGVIAGIVVAWYLEFWPLALIAALQLLAVPSIWRDARILRDMDRDRRQETMSGSDSLADIFGRLDARSNKQTPAVRRIGAATRLQAQLDMRPMSWLQGIAVSTVFLSMLVVPVAVLIFATSGFLNSELSTGFANDVDQRVDELRAESQGMTFDEFATDLHFDLAAPATTEQIAAAERTLGRMLPAALRDFYATTNGLAGLDIGPVADIVAVSKDGMAGEALELFAYEGALYFYFIEDSITIPIENTVQWWVIGRSANGDSIVFLDPDAAGSDPAVFHVFVDDAQAYTDVTDLLRNTWVNERWHHDYQEYLIARRDAAIGRLESLTTDELIDEFPRPGLLERILSGDWRIPDGATESQLVELEQRVGASLPADHRAMLKRHNGYPPLWLLSTEAIMSAAALDAEQVDYLLNADELIEAAEVPPTTALSTEELASCWVVIGVIAPAYVEGGNDSLYPHIFWCPELAAPPRYLSAVDPASYQDLSSALRFRVAQLSAIYADQP